MNEFLNNWCEGVPDRSILDLPLYLIHIKLKNAGCSKILKFGMDGKKKQSYECEKHEERLFTAPHRITTNVNKDIVIIDKI
jgi:hypothetical protein